MSSENREPRLLPLVLVPSIISNVVTVLRLVAEVAGLPAASPGDFGWWISLSLLIPLAGLYFAYKLQHATRPYLKLPLTLLVYALTVRIPTAFAYWLAGVNRWHSHYADWAFNNQSYVQLGLIPQVFIWPIITIVAGCIAGYPLLLWLRSHRKPVEA